jgi:hypothetical protein
MLRLGVLERAPEDLRAQPSLQEIVVCTGPEQGRRALLGSLGSHDDQRFDFAGFSDRLYHLEARAVVLAEADEDGVRPALGDAAERLISVLDRDDLGSVREDLLENRSSTGMISGASGRTCSR